MKLKNFAVVGLFFGMSLGVLLSPQPAIAGQPIMINNPSDAACWYSDTAEKILRLALEKSISEYGEPNIQYTRVSLPLSRAMLELQFSDKLDIQAAPAADQWPASSIPIPIPVFQGLSGYQKIYRNNIGPSLSWVDRAEQLRLKTTAMQSGCGKLLGDLLVRNGLKVRRVSAGASLKSMVELQRVDLVVSPAIVPAMTTKVDITHTSQVIADPKIMLYLPMPIYFYVSQEKPELAKRVALGMQRALQDGSMDRLLSPLRQQIIKDLNGRRLISMKNINAPENLQITGSALPGLKPEKSQSGYSQYAHYDKM
ncbi:hypothetical protein [Pelagibaculum spongiae]|uniref:Solute-binding protein family 3/N-terminal domain-containing protein n=1 Tax=Pelagibaculum spongiae TaxID=2080658 RepID=A0A2V1H4A6_9GAMM|nr:hypothetical protein [Pelagibaculum spongiae]PVZ70466.1 hypothetical protein DC094_07740 [Pelagibaculum spongiae]